MSEIRADDWVVTKGRQREAGASLLGHGDVFLPSKMTITVPVRAREDYLFDGWFSIQADSGNVYLYHPNWLVKVNQDDTPIEWSWLAELGWEE